MKWIKKLIEQLTILTTQITILIIVLFIIAIVLLGWGHIALRVIGIDRPDQPDTISVWLGFGIVLGTLEFLQLFFPLDWKVSLVVSLIGLCGITNMQWSLFTKKVIYQIKLHPLISFTVFMIVLIWCLRAMGVVNNYDSGLYHFQTIRWLNEYQLVPGLGNLHWRLALNQSYFNFLAVLNFYPYWNKGYAVGGLFLLFLSVCTLYETSLRQSKVWKCVFSFGLIVYFGYVASGVANPTPDGIIGLVQLAMFLILFQILSVNKNDIKNASDQLLRELTTLLILCFSIVTIKLTGALFSATSILITIWIYREVFNQYASRWLILATVLIVFTLTHIGRGYLLSGYPLFPSTKLGAAGLPWSLPIEFVKFEADLIMSWARMPGELDPRVALSSWQWLPVWFKAIPLSATMLLVFVIVSGPMTLAIFMTAKLRRLDNRYLVLYLPIFAALLFWFVTAPDFRFLGATLVLSALLTIWLWSEYLLVGNYGIKNRTTQNKNLVVAATLVTVLIAMKLTGLNSLGFTGWTEVPVVKVEIRQTADRLSVQIPAIGEQCWRAELPCVSKFNENLERQNYSFYGLNGLGLLNDFYFTLKEQIKK